MGFLGVYGVFFMALGSLSVNVKFCALVLMKYCMRHSALQLAGLWMEHCLIVEVEAFGKALTN